MYSKFKNHQYNFRRDVSVQRRNVNTHRNNCLSRSTNLKFSNKKFDMIKIFKNGPQKDVRAVYAGAVVWRCSIKKVFLEISRNSQENICAIEPLLKKTFWHRYFPFFYNAFLYRTPPMAASVYVKSK